MMRVVLLLCVGLTIAAAAQSVAQQLRASFDEFDVNKDGHITLDEFKAFYDTIDKHHGDGHINLHEFEALTNLPAAEAKLRFNLYDMDNDNDFTKSDMVLSFKDYDANGDGKVTFVEFKEYALAPIAPIGK